MPCRARATVEMISISSGSTKAGPCQIRALLVSMSRVAKDWAMKQSAHGALQFIETAIPGFRVARIYQRRWLRADLLAGVTIFAMLVPQGIAYAQLAGVAPVVGLYTAIGAMVGYAI